MRVAVLGGSGFLGARIARRLVRDGHAVVSVDRAPPSQITLDEAGIEHTRVDITRIEELWELFRTYRPDVAVNLAYMLTMDAERRPHASLTPNILGMDNVFEAARLGDVRRVVYASSIAVYGPQRLFGDRPVTEDDVPQPVWVYGASKLFNEFMARVYTERYGLQTVGIRVSTTFGYGRPPGGVAAWTEAIVSGPLRGETVELLYPPEQRFPMVYAEDTADCFVRIILAEQPRYLVYLCGGATYSLREVREMVLEHIPGADIRFRDEADLLPNLYRVDDSRAREELGFVRRPVPEGIRLHVQEVRQALQRSGSLTART